MIADRQPRGAVAWQRQVRVLVPGTATAMPAPAASYRPHVGVHLILTDGRKVLLLRRANTGFADGSWSVPGGSLDAGETLLAAAAREAKEEVGVVIDPGDLSFAHLCHHADPDGLARIGVSSPPTDGQVNPSTPSQASAASWGGTS